jgi:hypothetical protein
MTLLFQSLHACYDEIETDGNLPLGSIKSRHDSRAFHNSVIIINYYVAGNGTK